MISKTKLKIIFLIIFLIATSKLAFDLKAFNSKYQNRVYPNVYIDTLDVSGMKKEEIKRIFDQKNRKLARISVTAIYKDAPVATFSAQTLKIRYDSDTPAIQAYTIGRSKYFLSRSVQLVSSYFKLSKYRFESPLSYDLEPVKEFLAISEERYNHPAENALFKFSDGRVVNFKKERKGLQIETDQFLKDFENNVKNIKTGKLNTKLILRAKTILPEITLAASNDYGIEEEIAVGKSDYSHSIPERIHNVILAAAKFNGILIPPGEVFSFNRAIGDISSTTGYKPAYIIKDGKTVLGDGGGVCQVSTTLFRAAIYAGLPIIERHAHAYRVSYYENDMKPGYDATVFSPTVDLKIKNDTPAHILIETEVDKENQLLYFRFYGKKDSRQVEVGEGALWDVVPPPEAKYQDDPTLKKGITKQVDFPAWGSKASFTYKVTKGGKVTIDEKFYSIYKPWAAVYLVGTAD